MDTSSPPPHIVRSRIGRELAFPVGYELLRDHFGELPQWESARFYFAAHPTTFASEFAAILRAREPYRILRIEHRTATHVHFHIDAHWHFSVFPVRRELKSVARAALCGGSFEQLRDFVRCAPQQWNQYNRADAIFDPQEGITVADVLHELDAPNV